MKSFYSIVLSLFCIIHTSCSEDGIIPERMINECFDEQFFSNVTARNFHMGFSTWNYGPEKQDIDNTYSFIENNADIYSEQIDDVIPWESWINNQPLPAEFTTTIDDRVSRRINNHKLLLSVSLLNTGRDNLIEGFNGKVPEYTTLNDDRIAAAYVKHLKYLIERMNPDYLIVAMEANDLYLKDVNKWKEYKLLMSQVRAEIRSKYPLLSISESITLHNWYEPATADKSAYIAEVNEYVQNFDFASISFYPFFKGQSKIAEYQNAFDFLHSQVNKPIAFVETAHLAENLTVPSFNLNLPSDECQQNDYLEVLLANAEQKNYEFVIWWTHRDYDKLWETFPDNLKEIGGLWKDTGLVDEAGKERVALHTWKAALAK